MAPRMMGKPPGVDQEEWKALDKDEQKLIYVEAMIKDLKERKENGVPTSAPYDPRYPNQNQTK